jgi:hypothetical protein
MKRRRNDAPQDGPALVKETHKRKKGIESGDGQVKSRPVKRQRGRLQVISRSASLEKEEKFDMVQAKSSASTLAAKRYGKKGSPSPGSSTVTGIDYDELPGAIALDKAELSSAIQHRRSPKEAVTKVSAVSAATGTTRASAMRRKDEKLENSAVTKVKVDNKETKTRAKRTLNTDDVKIVDADTINPSETKRVTRSKKRKPDVVGFFKAISLFADVSLLKGKEKTRKADANVHVAAEDTASDPAKVSNAIHR